MLRKLAVTLVLLLPGTILGKGWTQSWGNLFHPSSAGVAVLHDGGAIAASNVGSDALLLRVTADGKLLWSRSLRHTGSIPFVTAAPNDDVFISGFGINATHDHVLAWIARIGADGNTVWERGLQGKDNLLPRGGAATRDGGVIVCGGTELQSWVVKLTAAGAIEWQHVFDAPEKDYLNTVIQTRDGGYLAGGHAVNRVLVKLSPTGEVQWRKGYGEFGAITSLAERPDGSIFVVGGNAPGMFVARLSPRGEVMWQEANPPIREDKAWDALLLPSGNLLVVGEGNSYAATGNAIMLMELSPAGEIVRQSMAESNIPEPAIVAHYGTVAPDGALYLLTTSNDAIRLRRIEGGNPSADDCWITLNATLRPVTALPPPPDWAVVQTEFTIVQHQIGNATAELKPGISCTPSRAVAAGGGEAPAIDAVLKSEDAFEAQLQQLLLAKDFAKLDEIASEIRRDRPLFRTLTTRLEIFYDGLSSGNLTSRIGQEQHLALLRAWIAGSPRSPSARIALAETMYALAWAARGGGYAGTISQHGGEIFDSLLSQAAKVLDDAAPYAAVDPEYFNLRMKVRQGGPAVAVRAAAKLPFYPTIYREAINYCRPQWGGTPEELHAVLDQAARDGGAKMGAVVYALAAFQLLRSQITADDFVNVWGMSWERARAGFRLWAITPPGDTRAPHWFARAAQKMGDRSTARELFLSSDLDWSEAALHAWGARSDYDQARTWALGTPVESNAAAPKFEKAVWPQMVMRSELRLTSGEHYDNLSAFLVKTTNGVVAVSAAAPLRPQIGYPPPMTMPMTANEQLRTRFGSWKLASALEVRGIAPRRSSVMESGVILDVGNPAQPPVHALAARMKPLDPGERVFLVGCPRSDSACHQNVYVGQVTATGGGDATVTLTQPLEIADFYGCPIVDEDGLAAAVVTDKRPPNGPLPGGAFCESMSGLLATAGSGALPPRP